MDQRKKSGVNTLALGGTWDPTTAAGNLVLSGDLLTATWPTSSNGSVRSTASRSALALAAEYRVTVTGAFGSNMGVGVGGVSMSGGQAFLGVDTNGVGYFGNDGSIYFNNVAIVTTGVLCASGDTITVGFDRAAGTMYWKKNGVLIPGSSIAIPVAGTLFAAISGNSSANAATANFS